MAIAIEVGVAPLTDIDIEWGSLSIVAEVDHQADIVLDVLRGSRIDMLSREVVYDYISFPDVAGGTGTYQKQWDPSAAVTQGGELTYLVVMAMLPASKSAMVASIPGSGITLTLAQDIQSAGFPLNYTEGAITLWYYIGAIPDGELTLQVTNPRTEVTADGGRCYFIAGTTFGDAAYLDSSGLATGSSGGTLPASYDSGALTALPFFGEVTAEGVTVDDKTNCDHLGSWLGRQTWGGYSSWGGAYIPEALGNSLKGVFSTPGFASGAQVAIAFTDSLDEDTVHQTGDIDVKIAVDHDTDIGVEVEGTRSE